MRARHAGILIGALAPILAASCTLEPRYHRPPAPLPAPQGGPNDGSAATEIGWHEFFPDTQLQQLIALALVNNRDLRVAAINVQSAQAHYRIQRAELFPTIDASALEEVEQFPNGVTGAPSGPSGGGAATSTGG